MTKQILQCEGGHTWEREARPGKKPLYCDDWPQCETLGEQMTVDDVIEDIELEQGIDSNDIERLSEFAPEVLQDNGNEHLESQDEKQLTPTEIATRGSLEADRVNPFLVKAQQASKVDPKLKNLEKAREVKAEKAAQRTQQIIEEQRAELAGIEERITRANNEYGEALNAAVKAPGFDEKLWNRADSKQQALLNILNRKRVLQKALDQDVPALVSSDKGFQLSRTDIGYDDVSPTSERPTLSGGGLKG